MTDLTVVTFVWPGPRGCLLEHASILGAMVRRHAPGARVVAIADQPGPCPGVEVIRTPPAALAMARLESPEGARFPSSYRRLWLFSLEAREVLGADRILLTDVDAVVVRDLSPLVDEHVDPFIGWRPRMVWGRAGEARLAGGMWALDLDTHTDVWYEFARDPEKAIARARAAGFRGSDQAWLSFKLAKTAPVWPAGSGVYSIRDFLERDRHSGRPVRGGQLDANVLPADARVVHLNGPRHFKPWSPEARARFPWVREHWRR
jgi:hypothetical protein